jgi:hypothetical protein
VKDFASWMEYGVDKGWVAPGVCMTHDLVPMHPEEAEVFEEGGDPCIPIIRVWTEKT